MSNYLTENLISGSLHNYTLKKDLNNLTSNILLPITIYTVFYKNWFVFNKVHVIIVLFFVEYDRECH